MAKKILIVDDSGYIRKIIEVQLRPLQYNVYTASNGLEAMKIIKVKVPDLILLDMMMPKKNGLEVIQELRGDNINVPIIVVSAKGQKEDVMRAIKAGANDYVVKPIIFSSLREKIAKLLNPEEPDQDKKEDQDQQEKSDSQEQEETGEKEQDKKKPGEE